MIDFLASIIGLLELLVPLEHLLELMGLELPGMLDCLLQVIVLELALCLHIVASCIFLICRLLLLESSLDQVLWVLEFTWSLDGQTHLLGPARAVICINCGCEWIVVLYLFLLIILLHRAPVLGRLEHDGGDHGAFSVGCGEFARNALV